MKGYVNVTYHGYRFNDDFQVFITKRPLPEFRVESSAVYGMDGEDFEGLTVGTRDSEIVVMALDKSMRGLQLAARKLADVLNVRQPRKLRYGDEDGEDGRQLYRMAVPYGTFDVEEFIRANRWTIRFRQLDPYLYGREYSVHLKANRPKRIDVGGNATAWPVVTVPNSGKVFTIQKNSGSQVTYKSSGGELVIDMHKQTVKGPAGDGLQTGSRFFYINDTVTLTANRACDVSWVERWL